MKQTLTLIVAGLLLPACSQAPAHTAAPHDATQTLPVVALADKELIPAEDGPARAAAAALVASMNDEQRAATVLPLDHDLHAKWHFVPQRRRGLKIGDMTDAQRVHLNHLLQAALSDVGYLKAMDIVWLESVLQELENRNDDYRDPGRYTLLLFGDPSDDAAAWGWRFEGHHLSLNFTYTPEGVVTTPMFMGTAPAVVPSGLHAGKRILAGEHNLAFAFIATLTDDQRGAMMIGDRPRDVITGPGRETALREPAGLAWDRLTGEQIVRLKQLIDVYLERYPEQQRAAFNVLLNRGTIYFAWAGSTNPDQPHYYRIFLQDQFVIEYNCQDNGVGHIHGVMHDLTDPLAEDLLRRHYERDHAGEGQ